MSIDEAIIDLEQFYEEAKNREFIRNPLAWALYQTWKKADREKHPHDGQRMYKKPEILQKPNLPCLNCGKYRPFGNGYGICGIFGHTMKDKDFCSYAEEKEAPLPEYDDHTESGLLDD